MAGLGFRCVSHMGQIIPEVKTHQGFLITQFVTRPQINLALASWVDLYF